MSHPLPLALTMGDPAGVGPLLTWRAWEKCKTKQGGNHSPFFVIASKHILHAAQKKSGIEGQIETITSPQDAVDIFHKSLPVLHIDCPETQLGQPNPESAHAIIESIQMAVGFTYKNQASGVVTNPINKALLYKKGFSFPGHTEFLAHLAHSQQGDSLAPAPLPIMMLVGGGLRVALATIHTALREVPDLITQALIEDVSRIVHAGLSRDFGLNSPRIALAGLNPHAGEEGSLGMEEIEQINPAAKTLRDAGLNISDAQPGDTVFHAMLDRQYDAVIAMYHDQGLAPLKSLDMWGGVNVTLGLPFIRTSPDHGTGYSVAADGSARADSLIAAINLSSDMAKARASA